MIKIAKCSLSKKPPSLRALQVMVSHYVFIGPFLSAHLHIIFHPTFISPLDEDSTLHIHLSLIAILKCLSSATVPLRVRDSKDNF